MDAKPPQRSSSSSSSRDPNATISSSSSTSSTSSSRNDGAMATPGSRPTRPEATSVLPPTATRPSSSGSRSGSRPSSAAVYAPPSPTKRLIPTTTTTTTTTSSILYAQPASVHFGGFSLDGSSSYSQRVFVHNNSAKPVRLQYTLPSTPCFRVRFPQERKPFISPGLSEELLVTFTPRAFQYYYDCVQIKCEQLAYASNTDAALVGKCLVPLHAYPVVNQVAFPTRMDFGAAPLGTTVHKHVDLTCSVPIEFEYELLVRKAHPSFTIFPLRGVIPANGTARIEFDFKPLLYATVSAQVELRVSQLDFTPLTCELTGSSASDTASVVAAEAVGSSVVTRRPRTAERGAGTGGGRGGAPLSPQAHSQAKTQQSPSSKSQPKSKNHHQQQKESATEPETVGGMEIPEDLYSMASVNFLLTQQPGKLKPKDLKRVIDANRAMRLEQQQQHDASASGDTPSDPSDPVATEEDHEVKSPAVLSFHVLVQDESRAIQRSQASRQIREMFFLQELAEIDKIEKELEFQSHKIRLGQELLTPEQLLLVREMREMNALELQRRERERLRNDVETTAFNMFTQPTQETPYPPRGLLPAHFEPQIVPDFKSYKNDLWARRRRVVQRLVRAISTVILRNRAQKRLEKVQIWLGNAKTRAQVRAKVALDWQQQQPTQSTRSSSTSSTSTSSTSMRASSSVAPTRGPVLYLQSFPIVEETERRTRLQILPHQSLGTNDGLLDSDPFAFFPLQPRDEALATGHELPLELPPLATFVPREHTRALRTGALDECCGAHQLRGATKELRSVVSTTSTSFSTLALLPKDVFLRRSAALRPLVVAPYQLRETHAAFALRPQRVFRSTPRHWGLHVASRVGSRSLRTSRLTTTLLRGGGDCDAVVLRTERPSRGTPPLLCTSDDTSTTTTECKMEEQELYRDVWDTSDGFVPVLSQRADDVPCLSDSESDDDDERGEGGEGEEEEGVVRKSRRTHGVPTWGDAVRLWDEAAQAEAEEEEKDDDDGVAYEPGELYGREQPLGVQSFPRYRHLIQSERAYNAYRDDKLQQLPMLLTEIASAINHPDYELVVHGHGPSRPLHEPFTAVFHRHQQLQKQ